MTTRNGTLVKGDGHIVTATWVGLLDDDEGQGLHVGNVDGLTVQLLGTLGAAGEVTMEGSNDGGTTWGTLQDPAGTPVVMDAIGEMFLIANRPGMIRPHVTNGEAVVTDLDVVMVGMRKGT